MTKVYIVIAEDPNGQEPHGFVHICGVYKDEARAQRVVKDLQEREGYRSDLTVEEYALEE